MEGPGYEVVTGSRQLPQFSRTLAMAVRRVELRNVAYPQPVIPMRSHSYQKYSGSLLDTLNVENLLENLADFLLKSGFEGGPHFHPWWGWSDDEGSDKSLDALKNALIQALIESGQLTPEMLAELRGEGSDEEGMQERIAALLDDLVQKLMEGGYLQATEQPQMPSSYSPMGGKVDEGKQAAQEVQFQLTQKGMDFLGFRTLRHLLSAIGRSSIGSHDTPHLATGVEADAASKPYEFGDSLNLDIPATLTNALARGGITVPLDLDYGDLMVHQAEYRSSCATVVLLDISH